MNNHVRINQALNSERILYVPAHFSETDISVLHELINTRSLGTWITQGDGELVVNHIPFFLDLSSSEHGTLVGHVARANSVWQSFSRTVPSVVVFQGPQAYISPAWYPSKQIDGKVVPTWNYAVAHVHGMPRIVEDRARLLEIVRTLTDLHEGGQAAPWRVSDAPADFIDALLGGIVGIEIPIAKLAGKWKVSQNRQQGDKTGTVAGLGAIGSDEANEMAGLIRKSTG
jgi:transcriptional regulator